VGHLGGDFEGELHKASYLARFVPRGLVDKFAKVALLDGVGVVLALGHQAVDYLA